MLRHMIYAKLPIQEGSVAFRKRRRYPFPMRDIVHQGRIGFRRNKNNPFPTTSDRYREWLRGYNLEYYSNLKRLRGEDATT